MNNELRTQFLAEYSEAVRSRVDLSTAQAETLEAADHLDQLIKANIELGDCEREAVENAIRQFGQSRDLGKRVGESVQHHQPSKLVFWFAIAFATFLVSFGLILIVDRIAWSAGLYSHSFVETDLVVAGVLTSIYASMIALVGRIRQQYVVIGLIGLILLVNYWFLPQLSSLPVTPTNLGFWSFSALMFAIPLGVLLLVLYFVGPRLNSLLAISQPLRRLRDER